MNPIVGLIAISVRIAPRADRSNQSRGRIVDHEIVWVGWISSHSVKDARDWVVFEAGYAIIIAGGIIQRTHCRKHGAGGWVKGIKSTLNAKRSRRDIKHSWCWRPRGTGPGRRVRPLRDRSSCRWPALDYTVAAGVAVAVAVTMDGAHGFE